MFLLQARLHFQVTQVAWTLTFIFTYGMGQILKTWSVC